MALSASRTLLAVILLTATAFAASVSLHAHPALTQTQTQAAAWGDVTAQLAHAHGVARLLRWGDADADADADGGFAAPATLAADPAALFVRARGSLVAAVAGLEPDQLPLPLAFDTTANTDIGAVADYLTHFTELISTEHSATRANVISISSSTSDNVLAIPGVSRVVLKNNAATVSLPDSTTATFKAKVKAIAKESYMRIQDSFEQRFDLKSSTLKESETADRMFMVEMNFFSSLCDVMNADFQDLLNAQVPGNMADYISVSITRLNDIAQAYGLESEKYKFASEIAQNVFAKFVDAFKTVYPDGTIQLLAVGVSSNTLEKRDSNTPDLLRRLAKVDPNCPLYFNDCMTLHNNCSNHGTCTKMRNPRSANQTCFFCSCYTNNTDDNGELIIGGSHRKVFWSGPQCAKQDISADFHLLLWTSVGLGVTLIFIVGLMASVGSDESSSQGAGAGKKKED
ncbi:hypothetical protein BDR26DRAFT_940765 [Obelidium mucronatum]|nr:hypothetical protein BDR26DRAFT_940765 [Obelidium mucronatum]